MVDKSTQRVMALIKAAGMSYAEAGEIAGCSAQAVYKWSLGGAISDDKLAKLAKHFDTTVAELRYGTDKGKPTFPSVEQLRSKYEVSIVPTGEEIARAYESLPFEKKHQYAVCIFHDAALAEVAPWLKFAVPMKQSYLDYLDSVRKQLEPYAAQLSLDLKP